MFLLCICKTLYLHFFHTLHHFYNLLTNYKHLKYRINKMNRLNKRKMFFKYLFIIKYFIKKFSNLLEDKYIFNICVANLKKCLACMCLNMMKYKRRQFPHIYNLAWRLMRMRKVMKQLHFNNEKQNRKSQIKECSVSKDLNSKNIILSMSTQNFPIPSVISKIIRLSKFCLWIWSNLVGIIIWNVNFIYQ